MILQRKKLARVYWVLETRRREKAFGAEISRAAETSASLWAHDAELLHLGLKRRALHAQFGCRAGSRRSSTSLRVAP